MYRRHDSQGDAEAERLRHNADTATARLRGLPGAFGGCPWRSPGRGGRCDVPGTALPGVLAAVVLGVTAWMARVAGNAPAPSRVGQTGQ
ncbi:hypothetical protein ACWEJ6_27880 [Nonomuraea sp. NPDC004702]